MSTSSPCATPDSKRWITTWGLLVLPGYLAYVIYVGLALPIDYFIYHDYAALQLTQDRLFQDLFPASIQSYLNPSGYLLLELLLRANIPSWWIALTFGVAHSLNGLFLLLIGHALARDKSHAERRVLWAGSLIGAVSPMLLSVVGTSFLDPLASVPMLAALWLLLRPADSRRRLLLAAFLAGAGTGLKLSNAPFALAIAALVLLTAIHAERHIKATASVTIMGALAMWAGILSTHGWWSWKLWERFGNPLFPLLNGVFKSPWAPEESLIWPRFVPQELFDGLTLPFRMTMPLPWIYTEATAPDLFPATAAILALVAAVLALKRHRQAWSARALATAGATPESRFWIYVTLGWTIWLFSSGNGRYAIPLLPLASLATALLAVRVLDAKRSLALCLLLLMLQLGNTWVAGAIRWSSGQWTPQWMTMAVPERLKLEPMVYLSADGVVKSALARHVHPDSMFVQLIGATYSVPSDGITGEWVQRAIDEAPGRILAVIAAPPEAKADRERFSVYIAMLSRTLDRVGLSIDDSRCESIVVNGQAPSGPNINRKLAKPPKEHLWVCAAHRTERSTEIDEKRRRADQVFAQLEARCPALYRPSGIQTEGDGNIWTRVYPMHDALVVTVNQIDGSVTQRLFGQSGREPIGSLDTWATDLSGHTCTMPFEGVRGSASLRHINFKTTKK